MPAPEADELAWLLRPGDGPDGADAQAESAYRALVEALAAQGASPRDLTSESLLVGDVRRDLPAILAARTRALSEVGAEADAPRPLVIGQPPAGGHARFVALASASVPHDRGAWSVRDVAAAATCPCAGCALSGARVVTLGGRVSLHTSNLYGTGVDAYAQASDVFAVAGRLLAAHGMDFHHVVRTWIHLRDIDRDYDALNAARRDFFARSGIDLRPASTGIGGTPFPDEHLCSLGLLAVKSPRPLDVSPMTTPLLNEAWSYGADFSRGLRVVEGNRVTLHVSGTASIDETGRTVHEGDFAAQAERMLDNLASLLARQDASFASLLSGVTYLRRARDADALHALYQRRGFGDFPCAVVEAALCRGDLLCETEAVAVLPRTPQGA